jgi:hypothetical protein
MDDLNKFEKELQTITVLLNKIFIKLDIEMPAKTIALDPLDPLDALYKERLHQIEDNIASIKINISYILDELGVETNVGARLFREILTRY